jgi:hypothetical protein
MTMPVDGIRGLLDARDVKRILQCSLSWVYKAAELGLIPSVRIPCFQGKDGTRRKDLVRFRVADLEEFIEKHYRSGQ